MSLMGGRPNPFTDELVAAMKTPGKWHAIGVMKTGVAAGRIAWEFKEGRRKHPPEGTWEFRTEAGADGYAIYARFTEPEETGKDSNEGTA